MSVLRNCELYRREHECQSFGEDCEDILRRAEKILGEFLGEALTANHHSAIRYAEEALDGIRGVKALKQIGLQADSQEDSTAQGGLMNPIFTHGSTCCSFLGSIDGKDLYICEGSYLLRYGNEGNAYWSQHDFRGEHFLAAKREVSGSGCDDAYYHRLVGIRLLATMLAGDMTREKGA